MNKYILFGLLFLIAIAYLPVELQAQKKVYGIPEALKQPKDWYVKSADAVKKRLLNNTVNKDKIQPWIVISDRDNNPVYDTKSTSGRVVRELQFRELFYVVDEDDDWIEIATASSVNKLKSKSIETIGWIPKARVLLWNAGLVDALTKINKKAFLL